MNEKKSPKKNEVENEVAKNELLTPEEIDTLGEIGNISISTSATTISQLLNRKVRITTPTVHITSKAELIQEHPIPYVAVEVHYTNGLEGKNLFILKTEDVLLITDLLMGGDGKKISGEIEELHLSAIGEVMNQMVGTSSTSLAEMFNKSINISPPKLFVVEFDEDTTEELFDKKETIAKISFKLEVEDLLESELMLLMPIDFSKGLVNNLMQKISTDKTEEDINTSIDANKEKEQSETINTNVYSKEEEKKAVGINNSIDVQPAAFPTFDDTQTQGKGQSNNDIGFISDVPLQVSVELGRAKKAIKDILLLNKGSIIELDKTNGEPVDIIVNGKIIAKGEVVVIDENFGVRITEIERRI